MRCGVSSKNDLNSAVRFSDWFLGSAGFGLWEDVVCLFIARTDVVGLFTGTREPARMPGPHPARMLLAALSSKPSPRSNHPYGGTRGRAHAQHTSLDL